MVAKFYFSEKDLYLCSVEQKNKRKEKMDYYKILGVDEKASQEEIKKAFKSLSKKYHPDKYANKSLEEKAEAENKFKEISEAYNVLSNENKRKEYDAKQNPLFGFNNPFDFNPFGGGYNTVIKGDNVYTMLEITLEDIYNNVSKDVKYFNNKRCEHCNGTGAENGDIEVCPHCNGTGRMRTNRQMNNMVFISETTCPHCGGKGYRIVSKCPHCNGTGKLSEESHVKITITPTACARGAIIVKGKGDASLYNGENGDLYIKLKLKKHDRFNADGFNLITSVNLNILELFNGCKKEIRLLNGKSLKFDVPPLTSLDKTFRIGGKGLTKDSDLYITVNLELPKEKLTDKQVELLEEFYKIEKDK